MKRHDDWKAWNHELMSRAVAVIPWECIDPDNPEDFLEKPGFLEFKKKVVPTQTRNPITPSMKSIDEIWQECLVRKPVSRGVGQVLWQ